MSELTTFVALLRGINVGGNNLISMARLRTRVETLGYAHVQTYINSGNVIFQSDCIDARRLEGEIENALVAELASPTKVIVLSFEKVEQIVSYIPKSWHLQTDQKCNVIFLHHSIDRPEIVQQFNPKPEIEQLSYTPGALFWSAKLSSITRSTMIKISNMSVYQHMTVRGLNTTRRIHQLMGERNRSS